MIPVPHRKHIIITHACPNKCMEPLHYRTLKCIYCNAPMNSPSRKTIYRPIRISKMKMMALCIPQHERHDTQRQADEQ